MYFNPLVDFIIEGIDNRKMILNTLVRFKHYCEWFNKEGLIQKFHGKTNVGENTLAKHVYEFLFLDGIQFSIESKSASGRTDFIVSQTEHRIIADVKIFDCERSKGKSYIIKSFNQVFTYTKDYNETCGYVVIFKTGIEELKFNFTTTNSKIPYLCYNNKVIYFLVIDLYVYEESASQRPKPKVIEISEKELVEILAEKI
jgi:hypothetical protein